MSDSSLITVELGERSYPIVVATNCLASQALFVKCISGTQVLLVTNETVAPLYLDVLKVALPAGVQVDEVILPDGEKYKTLETVNRIFDVLLDKKHNRTTTLIALGGGVIGDMTGFAAACYQRGVNFIQVPTTLLAQVDSSVGGKTGVNHPQGKNMIGAFYQPQAVMIDPNVLKTLPARELAAGLAEVIKYGLIVDAEFYRWLQDNMVALLEKNNDALVYAIKRSCECKAKVVAEDEKESGIRAILNLGHTFGHAIEAFQQYKGYLHGEAVAIGTVIAAQLSMMLGDLTGQEVDDLKSLFKQAGLPVVVPKEMRCEDFFSLMQLDKKVVNGALRLILLEAIGKAYIAKDIERSLIEEAIEACR